MVIVGLKSDLSKIKRTNKCMGQLLKLKRENNKMFVTIKLAFIFLIPIFIDTNDF